jgi:hypothetical protein
VACRNAAPPTDSTADRRGDTAGGLLHRRGAGLLYHGTDFVPAVAEHDGGAPYFVAQTSDRAVSETRSTPPGCER